MPTQTEISLNPASTKGSILTSNGSSRSSVAAGTNGQVLSAQSSATSGLEYKTFSSTGAAFELIASSVLTATATEVIFSNIDTAVAYTSFRLIGTCRTTSTTGNCHIRFNDVTTAGAYDQGGWLANNVSLSSNNNNDSKFYAHWYDHSSDASVFTNFVMEIFAKGNGMSARNIQILLKTSGWAGAATTTGNADFISMMGRMTGTTSELNKISCIPVNAANAVSAFAVGSSFYLYGFRR